MATPEVVSKIPCPCTFHEPHEEDPCKKPCPCPLTVEKARKLLEYEKERKKKAARRRLRRVIEGIFDSCLDDEVEALILAAIRSCSSVINCINASATTVLKLYILGYQVRYQAPKCHDHPVCVSLSAGRSLNKGDIDELVCHLSGDLLWLARKAEKEVLHCKKNEKPDTETCSSSSSEKPPKCKDDHEDKDSDSSDTEDEDHDKPLCLVVSIAF